MASRAREERSYSPQSQTSVEQDVWLSPCKQRLTRARCETNIFVISKAYGSLDEVMELKPKYYGHKLAPSPDPFSNTFLTSEEIKTSLLALSQATPDLHSALNAVFDSPEWILQDNPVPAALLRDPSIRVKDFDQSGAEWWPCQLGCPDGIPVNGTKTKQANRATEHIESHLGLWRYACTVCLRTFSRDQARKDHEKVHRAPENTPCEHGCGQRFEHGKSGNMKRHFKYACANNPNRIATSTGAGGSSSG